jgi:hypothetical protein
MNDTKKTTNTELVVDAVIDMLVAKNPLFETQREEYRTKLIPQYETYLMMNLMSLLPEKEYAEFEKLLESAPMDKVKHNEYLKDHVKDFSEVLEELMKNYLHQYSQMIDQMQ